MSFVFSPKVQLILDRVKDFTPTIECVCPSIKFKDFVYEDLHFDGWNSTEEEKCVINESMGLYDLAAVALGIKKSAIVTFLVGLDETYELTNYIESLPGHSSHIYNTQNTTRRAQLLFAGETESIKCLIENHGKVGCDHRLVGRALSYPEFVIDDYYRRFDEARKEMRKLMEIDHYCCIGYCNETIELYMELVEN